MADEGDKNLTRKQMELVLHRAAELERKGDGNDELVPVEEIERLEIEARLSKEALQRALVEMRSGQLSPPSKPGVIDRLFGPSRIVVQRDVPGEPAAIQMKVDRFFRDRYMVAKRNFGGRKVWEPQAGFLAGLLRTFQPSGRTSLTNLEIESEVLAGDPGRCRVVLAVDARENRERNVVAASGGILAGSLASGLLAVMSFDPSIIALVAFPAMGGLVGLGARSEYQRHLARVRESLEGFLDSLEHGST